MDKEILTDRDLDEAIELLYEKIKSLAPSESEKRQFEFGYRLLRFYD